MEGKMEDRQVCQKRILVMDDDRMVRELLGDFLNLLDCEVELAEDGAIAVELYTAALTSAKPYEAVILDLIVPQGIGGEETLKRLRAIDPHVKAIVCSGYSDNPVMAEYDKYGFSAAIAKPFLLEDLRKTLQSLQLHCSNPSAPCF
jgi:DNA-binding NtrC family response regulator